MESFAVEILCAFLAVNDTVERVFALLCPSGVYCVDHEVYRAATFSKQAKAAFSCQRNCCSIVYIKLVKNLSWKISDHVINPFVIR